MPAINELLQEGRYRINQQFVHDENSAVYEAYDTVNNTTVVVKEIPVRLNKVTTLSQQESIKAAFATEAKVLTEVHHDSLLHVRDFFSEIGRQYLVLESVEGPDLEEILKTNGKPFTVNEITSWADQLLDALNYLHTFTPPIIHRSVKPQNVKLMANGKIKLIAYGLASGSAAKLDTALANPSADASGLHFSPLEQIWEGLDRASQKVITNSYDEKSEMLLKQPADARSDIYGLGSTLYFLATGKKPIDALERSIDILEGKTDPLVSPSSANPSIPTEISNVIMRSLEIKREGRFDSASMMRQALKTSQVLIHERESAEHKEHEEALMEIGRFKEKMTEPVPAPVVATQAELSAMDDTESIMQQLREAEQMRIVAEERAAEAERLLRERDLALKPVERQAERLHEPPTFVPETVAEPLPVSETKPPLRLEPDPVPVAQMNPVLANPFSVPATAEQPVVEFAPDEIEIPEVHETKPVFAVEPADAENLLPELDVFSDPNSFIHVSSDEPIVLDNLDASPSDVFTYSDDVHEEQPNTAPDADVYDTEFGSSYNQPRSSFSMGMPMIAAAVGLIAVIAFGGWFLLSGDIPANDAVAPVQSAVTVETSQPEVLPEPVADPMVETATDATEQLVSDTPIEVERANVPQEQTNPARPQVAKQQPAAKPKKVETDAAKPAPAKKLTVDDLLNDD